MTKWMKNNWKRLVALIIIFIIFIVLIPLVINWAFKLNINIPFLKVAWGVDAELTFYGSIIAAVIAVFGVYLTIQYSHSNYQEDVRNRVLPFFSIDMLRTQSKYNFLDMQEEEQQEVENNDKKEQEGYIEYKLKVFYCVLENGRITYKECLSGKQRKLLDQGGSQKRTNGNQSIYYKVDYVMAPLAIENVGNGPALGLRIGLNRKETIEDDRTYLPPFSLKPGDSILFHLFSEDCKKGSPNLGEYVLSFCYEDIYGNKYHQDFKTKVYHDEEGSKVSLDISYNQRLIGTEKGIKSNV